MDTVTTVVLAAGALALLAGLFKWTKKKDMALGVGVVLLLVGLLS